MASKKDKYNAQHDELMSLLHKVPGVTEHMESFTTIMGTKLLKRRLELGLTQAELVKRVFENDSTITQATISKLETGHEGIKGETYNKVFKALGELEDIKPLFKESPQRDLVFS